MPCPFLLGFTQVFPLNPSYLPILKNPSSKEKNLYIFMSSLHTFFGALKKDKAYNDNAEITYLMRYIIPTKDNNLPFHLHNLFLSLKIMTCENNFFVRVPY